MKLTRKLGSVAVLAVLVALGTACDSGDADDGAESGGSGGHSGSHHAGAGAGSGGTAADGSGAGGACHGLMPDADCVTCMKAHCNTQVSECLGTGWATGNFNGGDCEEQMECFAECDCDDSACGLDCVQNHLTAACQSCMPAYNSCTQSHCASECGAADGGSGGAGAGGSGGRDGSGAAGTGSASGACATLQACCSTLKDEKKYQCDAAVQQNVPTLCSFAQQMLCTSS